MTRLPRPGDGECHAFFVPYLELVPDGDITQILEDQLKDSIDLLATVPLEQETYRYQAGKWSLREVIGHLIDAERLFAFRALTFARQQAATLPGIDNKEWGRHSNAHQRPLRELLDEWRALRSGNVLMFASFDAAIGAQTGVANSNVLTVRTFPWLIAGHELWHRRQIVSRYLNGH